MIPKSPARLIWRFFISFCRIIRAIVRTSILNCRNIFARKLRFASSNPAGCPRDISIFETPPCQTHGLYILLCSSQYTMPEFTAFFKSFRFHWSRWSGISVSVLGASIQTCPSAVNHKLIILYLACRSPYSVWFWCLIQYAMPQFTVSSKVSASVSLVGVGLVSLFWVLPSKHVLLPSIVKQHVIQCKSRSIIHEKKLKQFMELMRQVEMPNDILIYWNY